MYYDVSYSLTSREEDINNLYTKSNEEITQLFIPLTLKGMICGCNEKGYQINGIYWVPLGPLVCQYCGAGLAHCCATFLGHLGIKIY